MLNTLDSFLRLPCQRCQPVHGRWHTCSLLCTSSTWKGWECKCVLGSKEYLPARSIPICLHLQGAPVWATNLQLQVEILQQKIRIPSFEWELTCSGTSKTYSCLLALPLLPRLAVFFFSGNAFLITATRTLSTILYSPIIAPRDTHPCFVFNCLATRTGSSLALVIMATSKGRGKFGTMVNTGFWVSIYLTTRKKSYEPMILYDMPGPVVFLVLKTSFSLPGFMNLIESMNLEALPHTAVFTWCRISCSCSSRRSGPLAYKIIT